MFYDTSSEEIVKPYGRGFSRSPYMDWMEYSGEEVRARFRRVMEEEGLTVNRWAGMAGIKEGTLRAFLKEGSGSESLKLNTVMALAGAIGKPLSHLVEGAQYVNVVGYVGAGQQIMPFDDFPHGDGLEQVEAPSEVVSKGGVGLRVRGDSMYPAYKDGDIIFYWRSGPVDLQACLNRECVVMLADGRCYVKTLRKGSQKGRFNLASHNAPEVENVELEWAARIKWVEKA